MISRFFEQVKAYFYLPSDQPERVKSMEAAIQAEPASVPTQVITEQKPKLDQPDEILYILSDNGKKLSEKIELINGLDSTPYLGRTYYYKSKHDPFTVFDFKNTKIDAKVTSS